MHQQTSCINCNYFIMRLTFLVFDSTVCPAASASKVNNTFTDNGDIKTLFGSALSTVCGNKGFFCVKFAYKISIYGLFEVRLSKR